MSTLTHDDILAQLTGIFRTVFDDDSLVLHDETTAQDVPGWDSMNHITVVVEAERHFGIKVRTAEIEELRNVGDFVSLIQRKRG
jgi:acyl carrier protein